MLWLRLRGPEVLITVGSVKGSPGATTFAALLARMWPDEGYTEPCRMLLEADLDGASLAALWHESLGTAWSPGVVEFAAAARGDASMVDAIGATSQPVGGDVELVPGVPNRATMANAVASLSDTGLADIARFVGLVVADVGRYRPQTAGLVRRSQLSVVVCRPTLADAQLLEPVVAELSNAGGRVGLVTVGDQPYGPAEIADTVGIDAELAWSVLVDRRTAALVGERGPGGKVMLRSRLGRRVRTIAKDIALRTDSPPAAVGRPVRPVRGQLDATTQVASSTFGEVVNRG